MARIPTLDIPAVQSAPYPGRQIDVNAAMAPARGTQAIAGAIGQVGQLAGEFALRAARSREEATLVNQQKIISDGYAAYEEERARTPNSKDWVPLWDKYRKNIGEAINQSSSDLGADGKARASEQFATWAGRTDVRIRTEAAVQGVKEDKQTFVSAAIDMWQSGNFDAGKAQLDKAKDVGAISDAEYNATLRQGHEVTEFYSAQDLIARDPVNAESQITREKYPNLNSDQRRKLQSFARTNLENVRADTMRAFDEEIVNIQENNANPTDIRSRLRAAMEGGTMLPSQYAVRIKRLDGTLGKDFDAAAGSLLWEQIEQVDPKDKVAVLELRNKLKVIDPYLRQDMDKALDDKLKPPTQQQEKPTAAIDALKGMLDANVFGPSKIPEDIFQAEGETKLNLMERSPAAWIYRQITGTKPGTHFVPKLDDNGNPIAATDQNGAPVLTEEGRQSVARFEAARAKHKEYLDHMIRWYRQHPGASGNEQIEELRRVTAGDTDIMNGSKAVNWINGFAN